MVNQVVIDEDGSWFVNTGAFSFKDPISGHVFIPHVPVKLKPNDWVLSQPVIKAKPADKPVSETDSSKEAKPTEQPKAVKK